MMWIGDEEITKGIVRLIIFCIVVHFISASTLVIVNQLCTNPICKSTFNFTIWKVELSYYEI